MQPIANLRQLMTTGIRTPYVVRMGSLDMTDDEFRKEALISRYFLRSDNQNRVTADFETICELARYADQQRTMDLTNNGALADSGNEGFLGPMVTPTVVGLLGTPTFSARLGNDGASPSEIPSINNIPSTQMLLEDEAVTESDLTTGSRELVAYTQGTQQISITRRLLKQSSIDLPGEVANLVRLAHAIGNQRLLLTGDNAGTTGREPDGILNATGVQAIDATASFDATDIVGAQKLLNDVGGDARQYGAMCSPAKLEVLMNTVVEAATDSRMVTRSNSSVTGYILKTSADDDGIQIGIDANIPDTKIIIGQFSKSRIIVDREVDILFTRTGAAGRTQVFSFEEVDVVIDRPEAFLVITTA